ncbi:MAG: EAL domain-containing protein [Nitrospirota bacterium]|jgi:diguanylate cyclase (GGDEF)-like protein/PAS domain S-box-containing protein
MKKSIKNYILRPSSMKINMLASAVAIVLLAVHTIFFVHPSFIKSVTENSKMEAFRVGQHLASMYFSDGRKITREDLPPNFIRHIEDLKMDFTFFKLKLFSPTGEVVFSTDEGDVGTTNAEPYFQDVVAKGRTYAKVVQRGRQSIEHQTMQDDVVETYVPIMDRGTFLGAFELYYDVGSRMQRVEAIVFRSTMIVLFLSGALMAVIIISSLRTRRVMGERNAAMERLRNSEEKFSKLFHHSNDGIILHDVNGTILEANEKAVTMLGYSEDELGALRLQDLHELQDLPLAADAFQRVVEDGFVRCEISFKTKSRGTFPAEVSASLFSIGGRSVIQEMIRDITERKRLEEQLESRALHDDLTGLANRVLFTKELRRLEGDARERGKYGVLFLDLDGFKVVNDSLGHARGDELLVEVGHRLRECVRAEDTIARLGGDEFAILARHCLPVESVTTMAGRILKEMERPFAFQGREVYISASIGIALSSPACEPPEQLLRDADTAMYHAKKKGRARFVFFEESMHVLATRRLALESDLRRALDKGQFHLHYQPIVALQTGRVAGLEALLRWSHPTQGSIPPAEFIPVAEETGLILPIGRWTLREACTQMALWKKRFPQSPPLTINVNISSKLFRGELLQDIEDILKEAGLEAQSLVLEITETAIMEKSEAAPLILSRLRNMGVRLHIDDFGTGYSSLSYLHRFPIEVIKVDRTFTGMIGVDREKEEIIRAILNLATSLRMGVTAEGVETLEQATFLKAAGCTYSQGFLHSRALDSEAAEAFLAEHPGVSSSLAREEAAGAD